MPMQSANLKNNVEEKTSPFSCQLGRAWKNALKRERFSIQKDMFGAQSTIYDKKYDREFDVPDEGHMDCCGLTELNMSGLSDEEVLSKYSEENVEELVAKYINLQLKDYRDNRIVIVGLPVANSNDHKSQYNFENYNRILKAMLTLGFKKVTQRPYINENSANKLHVLVGQIPSK